MIGHRTPKPVGIVLILNRQYEDFDTYLADIDRTKRYNVPKGARRRGQRRARDLAADYNHLEKDKWLLIYDSQHQAITVIGKVSRQKYDHHNHPDFPCFNYFDPAQLFYPTKDELPLRFLGKVFPNFESSRRYRNISRHQFDRLRQRVSAMTDAATAIE